MRNYSKKQGLFFETIEELKNKEFNGKYVITELRNKLGDNRIYDSNINIYTENGLYNFETYYLCNDCKIIKSKPKKY